MRAKSEILLVSILSLGCMPGLSAEKSHQWEHAKVISQDQGSSAAGAYAAPLGNGTIAVPLYRNWNRVVVETDRYVYQWNEVGRTKIILPVNGEVAFYREGDWFIIMDSNNKKHKFGLVGMTAKQ